MPNHVLHGTWLRAPRGVFPKCCPCSRTSLSNSQKRQRGKATLNLGREKMKKQPPAPRAHPGAAECRPSPCPVPLRSPPRWGGPAAGKGGPVPARLQQSPPLGPAHGPHGIAFPSFQTSAPPSGSTVCILTLTLAKRPRSDGSHSERHKAQSWPADEAAVTTPHTETQAGICTLL